MERLTDRREDGTATGIKRSIGDFVGIPEMLMRLAEYEDTGMTPQDIADLEARLQETQAENKRLTQLLVKEVHFDKDGLNIKLGGEGAMMFINYLVDLFKMNGGDNFLVPEALEMVVEELAVTQKALELAEKIIIDAESLFDGLQTGCVNVGDIRYSLSEGIILLTQAKEGEHAED